MGGGNLTQNLDFSQGNFSTDKRFSLYRLIAFCFIISLTTGCAQSPAPSSEDIIKLQPPQFDNGGASGLYLSPAMNYTVTGSCDSAAKWSEYSINDSAWEPLPCPESVFTLTVLPRPIANIRVRSKGTIKYTAINKASVRYVAAPASNSVLQVASSRSDVSDFVGVGTQDTIPTTFSGDEAVGTTVKIQTNLPKWVYENQ
jgi:hypothetical protein